VGYGFGSIIDLPVSFALWPLLLSFGFACAVGLFFGVYPAVRAADLDPIKALQRV
jgi:putative ABC transport system permease protein